MTVYVVFGEYQYEGCTEPFGVFTTEAAALEFCRGHWCSGIRYEPYELDKGDKEAA